MQRRNLCASWRIHSRAFACSSNCRTMMGWSMVGILWCEGGGGVGLTFPKLKKLHSFFLMVSTRRALAALTASCARASLSARARLRSSRWSRPGSDTAGRIPQERKRSFLKLHLPPFAAGSQRSGERKQHVRRPSLTPMGGGMKQAIGSGASPSAEYGRQISSGR